VKPSCDYVGKRVDRITDTIASLHHCAQARRTFTTAEVARLSKAWRELERMLLNEGVNLG